MHEKNEMIGSNLRLGIEIIVNHLKLNLAPATVGNSNLELELQKQGNSKTFEDHCTTENKASRPI